ncbi:MAG: hypothetical protein DRP51_03565 [Candidatus Zixiibacteriota bacterium]|nr:MAG: hypothetical protein DRP51_03565 [candidate division Zixibacteria bacterium]
MIDKDKAMNILKKVLSHSKAELTEAVLESERLSLTRFAESKIHQNIDREETILYVRTIRDKKIGVTATGDISDEGIKRAVANCEAMHKYIPPDENFMTLPGPDPVPLPETRISEGTAGYNPQMRAEAVETIAGIAADGKLEASGAFRIEQKVLAVTNSRKVERFFAGSSGELSMTLSGKDGNSGWAKAYSPDISQIDISALADKAAQKAILSKSPISLPDGKYTVILEPAAVGQLLLLLSFMGFGGRTFYQHRSFMSGKIGEKIAGDNFTVYEDPTDDDFCIYPFDYEGVPRRKVPLIANGYGRGVVYNSYYAALMNTESTGHALAPTNRYGPYPKAMSVATGNSSLEKMIASTESGILITHFWYLNFLNPMRTMVTGTTRDGTFLIKNGKIDAPVKNMRTNQSILEAFSNIELITKEAVIYPQYSILMKVPGMKINNFNLAAEDEDNNKC